VIATKAQLSRQIYYHDYYQQLLIKSTCIGNKIASTLTYLGNKGNRYL